MDGLGSGREAFHTEKGFTQKGDFFSFGAEGSLSSLAVESSIFMVEKKEQLLVDQISELPDDILVHILSLLPLEEAARTSILSKRWIDLWLSSSTLDFHAPKMWKGMEIVEMDVDRPVRKRNCRKYVQWVNKVLKSHKAMVLDVFRIRFDLTASSKHNVNKWLQYAFARRVKRLELNLLTYRDSSRLDKVACDIRRELLHGLSSNNNSSYLRSLTLRFVNVTGEDVTFFLQNCPFLEHLVVDTSRRLTELEVCGPSLALKHLEALWCSRLHSVSIASIPNLVCLKVTVVHRLVLRNVPMLVDVVVGMMPCLVAVPLSWLSGCLSTLVVLTLLIDESVFVRGRARDVPLLQLTQLKQFTLCVDAGINCSVMEFTALIRASPKLEKFALKLQWKRSIAMMRTESIKALAFPLQHLKVVEIIGYYGRTTEIELVEYFVENAVALQKITVDPRYQPLRVSRVENPQEEETARNLAKRQRPHLLPSHVQLAIL